MTDETAHIADLEPFGDVPGCLSVTDFRTDGLVLLTRCRRSAEHSGRHSDKQTKKWTDAETTWRLYPPG